MIASQRDYLAKIEDPLLQPLVKALAGLDEVEQWNRLIEGFEAHGYKHPNIMACCKGYLEWEQFPQAAILRYEHLMRTHHSKVLLSALGRGVSHQTVETALREARNDKTPTLNKAIVGRGGAIPRDLLNPQARKLLRSTREMLGYFDTPRRD